MILVSVGTQLRFDRLVGAVDRWAQDRGRTDVLAQIGEGRTPRHVRWVRRLAPAEFRAHLAEATLVVAHAGMGVTISALEAGKPVLVVPRRAALREHRNEHQLATARRLARWPGVRVCESVDELPAALDRPPPPPPPGVLSADASPELLAAVRGFVFANRAA